MLIGAHVSPAGGIDKAVGRGIELGARAIQIFNQSPRMWKPRIYSDDEVAAGREALAASEIDSLLIHAVYLLNCASEDAEIRAKSLTSLVTSLRAGAALGADGVVLHPGSALKGEVAPALERAAAVIAEALEESEKCALLLEDTAGSGATLGRSFEELATLIEGAGADDRLGLCLDCCHLIGSGYDIRDAEKLTAVLADCDRIVGLGRLRAVHVNDSKAALGSNVDRHINLGDGELGEEGCAAFLSEPRFEGLPAILEGPGREGKGLIPDDLAWAAELRSRGLARRS